MDHIGRYQILEEIGRGAMGIVYRAQDPAIGRVIAIKTIRLTDLTDANERERLRERLFREAQSAGSLSHPNIVTIYDIAEENGNACIFMELVNGPTLEELLSAPKPPDKESIFSFLRQTANALDYAHRKGIVHRDIKPANIMIHDDGQAKITDFGVAKTLSHQMTQSGTMMGTPNYMSPEQVQGLAVDGRADQFAIAVIAYEVLTGEKPFTGEYLPTLLYKIVREDPVPPARLNPALDPEVETVFRKALAKDSQQRYATCVEFVSALTHACNRSPHWQPMPRGSSQSMPTLAGSPPPAAPAPPVRGAGGGLLGQGPVHANAPQKRDSDRHSDRNPLVRSLVWVLVGVGLVGLVLLGAQKLLFNPGTASQTSQEQAPSQPAPTETPQTVAKPSPVGESPIPGQTPPPNAAKPGEPTAPELPGEARAEPPPSRHNTAPSVPGATGERTIQLLTEPPGAHVVIDGNSSQACTTPCMLSLSAGRHTMSTHLDGYRPYPKVLNVPQDGDQFLKLAKTTGTLSVASNPPGATIQLNGETQKQTTPANFTLAPGTYHVRVTRDGVPLEFDVDLKDGEFQHRNVNFQ